MTSTNIHNQYGLEQTNFVAILVGKFESDRASLIESLEQLASMTPSALNILNVAGANIPSLSKALHLLNISYWQQVFMRSGVQDLLDETKRDKWRKDLSLDKNNNAELPDFNFENVVSTLTEWYSSRESMFVDKVDNVFQKLSSSHVTNEPQGFGRKMIFKYGCDEPFFSDSSMSLTYQKKELMFDLASIIATIMKLPMPDRAQISAFNRLKLGCRHACFGGAFEIQVFKNRGIHVWIHPYVAIEMNLWLAKKYPAAIPPEHRAHKKEVKEFRYTHEQLTTDDAHLLNHVVDRRFIMGHHNYPKAAEKFCKFVGLSVEDFKNIDRTNNSYFEVAQKILLCGYPCIQDHQYYPTPPTIVDVIKETIGDDVNRDDISVLEPSAGSGRLARIFNSKAVVECVEVSEIFSMVLKSHGFNHVYNQDFLKFNTDKQYDYIVMNPPYANKRLELHLAKALEHLKADGRLIIVAPSGKTNTLRGIVGEDRHLSVVGSFKGVFEDTQIETSVFLIT